MQHAAKSILVWLLAFFILGGCITRVDEALPYGELPKITVAAEIKLAASPSHPSAYLPVEPIAEGTSVQIVGSDKDAAWLLVLHNNILGWMPTFFSRDNVATLNTAITFELLSDKCTNYLDTTFGLDTTWNSTAEGSVIAFGTLYRPNTPAQAGNSSLAIQIDGTGQAFESDYVYTALTDTSSLVLFAFEISNLEKGSQISFLLNDADNKSFFFQALFFSDTCAKSTRFTDRLPVGKPRSVATQTSPQPQQTVQPVETLQPESTTIVHTSDARTPTSTPTATPLSTLNPILYGDIVPIREVVASSFYSGLDHTPDDIADGDIKSYWISQINDDIGAWIELRLAVPTALTGIRVFNPGVNSGNGLPSELSLQFPNGSKQNITIDSNEGWYDRNFPLITTDSISIVVESLHNYSVVNTTRLYEIQVLGAPIPPLALETENTAIVINLRNSNSAIHDDSIGNMKAVFLKNSGESIVNTTVTLSLLEEDIAGDLLRMEAVVQNQSPDEKGFYVAELPPQQYLLTLDVADQGSEPIVPGWLID